MQYVVSALNETQMVEFLRDKAYEKAKKEALISPY